MKHWLSLVVATKDRPDDLRRMLRSLQDQTTPPAEIVLVDASFESVESILDEFPVPNLRYLRHLPPSAAAQRNAGIDACSPNATLIGFADDDILFEPNAFELMMRFWGSAPPDTLGAAFNLRNYPQRGPSFLKNSKLSESLGLYSPRPGSVSRSGWQTVIPGLSETKYVAWLPTTAVTFRKEAFQLSLFDDFYESYSYLEDLDLSYTISRRGRLAVVAEAGYLHFPSPSGRVTSFQFGRYEVRNRLHFVRKQNLSLARCYLGIAIRLAMSVGNGIGKLNRGQLERALGNLTELVSGIGRLRSSDERPSSRRRNRLVQTPDYRATDDLGPKEL
jgi:glycosyltransferase involved in cell wall biosynthesis